MKPAVLMTDPRHFAIKGGANPHTRRADNSLKEVDLERAWPQWHAYIDRLLAGGVDVYIIDATPELTGMVFAANAGFLTDRLEKTAAGAEISQTRAPDEKVFYPSHFTAAHRVGESALFSDFMADFGFSVADYPAEMRFEGEADAFPVGRGEKLEWVFTWGFRSDPEVADWLDAELIDAPATRLKLTDARYYHGDCLLCDLGGPVLAWTGGLDDESVAELRRVFSGRLVEMSDEDAADFVGNSFYVETAPKDASARQKNSGNEPVEQAQKRRLLFAPAAIKPQIRAKIEAQGVEVVPVDVSEFFGKGGGGPKCMVFNLGLVDMDDPRLTPGQREFRRARHVQTLRKTRWSETRG